MGNNIVRILLMIIGGSAEFFHTVHFGQSAGNHYPKIYPQSTLRI